MVFIKKTVNPSKSTHFGPTLTVTVKREAWEPLSVLVPRVLTVLLLGKLKMAGALLGKKSFREVSFTAPWGVIAAKSWGPDDGKPFLGLHGWIDNANTFDRLAHLLPDNIHFMAMDFPGHGKSSHRWPGMPYSFFEYVADVKKVVSQLGWSKFSIIGHSMGAGVASLYAGTFPHEVDNLILLDFGGSLVSFTEEKSEVLAQYATEMSSTKVPIPRIYQSVESAADKRKVSSVGHICQKDALLLTERGTRVTAANGFIFSHDPMVKYSYEPFEAEELMTSIYSNICCAVLALRGTDHIFGPKVQYMWDRLIEAISLSAKYKECKKVRGGHFFHLENPEEVAQEIKEFVARSKSKVYALTESKL